MLLLFVMLQFVVGKIVVLNLLIFGGIYAMLFLMP